MQIGGDLSPRDLISRAKVRLYKDYPFFSYLVDHLRYVETETVPTAAVNAFGKMYYNPNFVSGISKDEVLGLLAHEVMHLALEHPKRMRHRSVMMVDPEGNIVTLWNFSADIVINNILTQNNLSIPKCGLVPRNNSYTIFGYEVKDISKKSTEEIYDELKIHLDKEKDKQKNKQKQDQDDDQDGDDSDDGTSSNGKPGKGKPKKSSSKGSPAPGAQGQSDKTYRVKEKIPTFDEHKWDKDDPMNQSDKSDKSGNESKDGSGEEGQGEGDGFSGVDWKKVVAEAGTYSKQRGITPAGMEREFHIMYKKKLNLDSFLRREIGKHLPKDLTWMKPNKKYVSQDVHLPSFYGEHVKVLFSIDTSGSVTQEDLSRYISIIIGVCKSHEYNIEFRLLSHDADVQDDYHVFNGSVEKIKKIKVHGGGGTDHRPLYSYIEKKRYDRDTKILFSFTDGYSAFPEHRPHIRTVFILCGSHCTKEAMPSWSEGVISIDPEKD